jgi:hypothetical protein
MPTNRQLRTRKPKSAITAIEFEGLLTGTFWFNEPTEARMRELWTDHRVELETFWSQDPEQWKAAGNTPTFGLPEPGGPFSRCWAWWKFEAPEPRRRIGGEGIAAIDSADCPTWAKKLSFGRPTVWDDDYGDETETWFETQKDYLIRLDLLTVLERRELSKSVVFTAAGGTG